MYFIITMYVIWIGLILVLAIKETFYENDTSSNR